MAKGRSPRVPGGAAAQPSERDRIIDRDRNLRLANHLRVQTPPQFRAQALRLIIAADEHGAGEPKGQGELPLIVQVDEGTEKVGPGADEGKERDGGERRLGQR